jgi:hypothetical protein
MHYRLDEGRGEVERIMLYEDAEEEPQVVACEKDPGEGTQGVIRPQN